LAIEVTLADKIYKEMQKGSSLEAIDDIFKTELRFISDLDTPKDVIPTPYD